jgi:hypothetical protein
MPCHNTKFITVTDKKWWPFAMHNRNPAFIVTEFFHVSCFKWISGTVSYNNITRHFFIKYLRYTKQAHLLIHTSIYVLIFLAHFLTLDYFLILIFLIPSPIFPSIVIASFFCLSYNIVKLLFMIYLLSLLWLTTVNNNNNGAIRTRTCNMYKYQNEKRS